MGKLIDALQTKDKTTWNGMTTNSTSLNACVDMFSRIGSMRNEDRKTIVNLFVKAFDEDALTAMKVLFWARDIRGGAGERKVFRYIMNYLSDNRTEVMRKNLANIPVYGRWDDVFHLIGTPLESDALDLIAKALDNKDGLCAKWLPRPNVNDAVKKAQAKTVRARLKLTPKDYRKLLAEISNTVEQLMCAGKWSEINYSHVPSKAMADYMKAFGKRDQAGFSAYLESLEKGETKINASAVYPYDIVKAVRFGDARAASAQWLALPNYMEENQERVLPLVDVSGSMQCPAGGSKNVTCMDVAISLGLYISERNEGPFKYAFLTFESIPKLMTTKGSLADRVRQMGSAPWGGSTNIEAAYKTLLSTAVSNKLTEDDMPTMLLILSDMQFNSATGGWSSSSWNPTAQEMVEGMYATAGYKMPKVVYWNLNAANGDSPVQFDKQGTALVSGFSPSLLRSLLSGKNVTPYSMMMDTIGAERYDLVTI